MIYANLSMLSDNHNYKLNIMYWLCLSVSDKNFYRHDGRADKNPYRHDRSADSQCHDTNRFNKTFIFCILTANHSVNFSKRSFH